MQPLPKSKSISLYLQFILVGLPMEWLLFLQWLERYFSILTSPYFWLHALQPYTQICWSIHQPIRRSLCWSIHLSFNLFDVFVVSIFQPHSPSLYQFKWCLWGLALYIKMCQFLWPCDWFYLCPPSTSLQDIVGAGGQNTSCTFLGGIWGG